MSKFESQIKQIAYTADKVYAKLSDLNNLAAIKNKLNDPDAQEKLKEKIPADKFEQVKNYIESMQFDTDTVSMNIAPVGSIAIQIIEREPTKCIKFASTNSPIGFNLWIQIRPTTETTSKMRLTIDASLNPFIKAMVEKPLREGIDKLADMLAMMPYDN